MSLTVNCSYIATNQSYIENICDTSNNYTYCCPTGSHRTCSQSTCGNSNSVNSGSTAEDVPLKDPVVFWYFLAGLLVLGLIVLMLTYLFFKHRKPRLKLREENGHNSSWRMNGDTGDDDTERSTTTENGEISFRDKFRRSHDSDMLSRGSSRIVLVESPSVFKPPNRHKRPSKLPQPIYSSDSPRTLTPRDTPTQLPDVG